MIQTQPGRWLLTLFAVAVVVTLGLGAAIAFDDQPTAQDTASEAGEAESPNEEADKIPVRIGGMQIAIDPETGDLQPLTKAQAKQLAKEMRKMFPSRAEVATEHPDGSVSAVVMPNVLRLSVARIEDDGKVSVDCAEGVDNAIDFVTGETAPSAVPQKREEK